MKEFEIIDYIKKLFAGQTKHKDLILPIGDDCSVIRPKRNYCQVTTVDSLVNGNHFSSKYFSPKQIGRKAIRVNLSDLASMGAVEPFYAWLVMAITDEMGERDIKGVLGGIREDCKKYNVTLAGGNITSASQFSIHLTLSGWIKPANLLTRKGANVGDSIFVTGSIGASTMAYRQFKKGAVPDKHFLKRWATPHPKLEIGKFLSEKKIASSCIDISDGIFQDLGHIIEQSSVGATVYWDLLPIDPKLKKLDPTPDMIGFGEDYELLFTVPGKKIKMLSPVKSKISRIGVITKSGLIVMGENGNKIDVTNIGYSHIT